MIDADQLSFDPLSEDCLLVSWPSIIDMGIINQVNELGAHLGLLDGIIECVPAYASLAIYFDSSLYEHSSMKELVLYQLKDVEITERQINTWEIPVCYDPSLGPDQKRFAEECGVDLAELIALHTKIPYTVLMRGFQPGFLYMGAIDERLHLPRLAKPRSQVSAGSVGIADEQTGIYPLASPGGWNIIGCTPTRMLDFSSSEVVAIQQGDLVRFTAINMDVYQQMHQTNNGPARV